MATWLLPIRNAPCGERIPAPRGERVPTPRLPAHRLLTLHFQLLALGIPLKLPAPAYWLLASRPSSQPATPRVRLLPSPLSALASRYRYRFRRSLPARRGPVLRSGHPCPVLSIPYRMDEAPTCWGMGAPAGLAPTLASGAPRTLSFGSGIRAQFFRFATAWSKPRRAPTGLLPPGPAAPAAGGGRCDGPP